MIVSGRVHIIRNMTANSPGVIELVISMGKCQFAQIRPKIKLAPTGLYFSKRKGRTKPRHPNSSPKEPPNKKFSEKVKKRI